MRTTDRGPWRVLSRSVRGPKHATREQDNQDAAKVYHPQKPTLPIALAVADGHGSARYIRSGQGSRIAVELAVEHLAELELSSRETSLTTIKRAATEQLSRKLHLTWTTRVMDHLATNPLTEDERAGLLSIGVHERDLQTRPEFLYGTTLLAALLTSTYAIFVQIGDGDLMVAWPSGQPSTVFASDEQHLGDQTHSLASPNAWRHIQVLFQPLINEFPLLILASTDGYAKAFHTQNDFLQVATDLTQIMMADGTAEVADNLSSWLEGAAELSGDDATVAMALQLIDPPEATRQEVMTETNGGDPLATGGKQPATDEPDEGAPTPDEPTMADPTHSSETEGREDAAHFKTDAIELPTEVPSEQTVQDEPAQEESKSSEPEP